MSRGPDPPLPMHPPLPKQTQAFQEGGLHGPRLPRAGGQQRGRPDRAADARHHEPPHHPGRHRAVMD